MLQYVRRDLAIAMLVAGMLKSPEPKRTQMMRERINWIENSIPEGYEINESLIRFSMGKELFDDIKKQLVK